MRYTSVIEYMMPSGQGQAEVSSAIMASMDCMGCSRTNRTVVFPGVDKGAFCTPTKHKFEGNLQGAHLDRENAEWATFTLDYEYSPFCDKKRSIESTPNVSWARVKVRFTCRICGKQSVYEDQSNMSGGNPIMCECGAILGNLSHVFQFQDAQSAIQQTP